VAKKNNIPSPVLSPSRVATLRRHAIAFGFQGDWKEAIICNEQIITSSKPLADDFNRLGRAYTECKRLNDALSAYEKCLKIDPTNTIALKHINEIKGLSPPANEFTVMDWILKAGPAEPLERPIMVKRGNLNGKSKHKLVNKPKQISIEKWQKIFVKAVNDTIPKKQAKGIKKRGQELRTTNKNISNTNRRKPLGNGVARVKKSRGVIIEKTRIKSPAYPKTLVRKKYL
jgi:tetratricopeptide (TPR) repeat protein